jgi:hypothetical protein
MQLASSMPRPTVHVRLTPNATQLLRSSGMSRWARKRHMHCSKTPLLFDDLVGAQQDRSRHVEAERLGGLEVDN